MISDLKRIAGFIRAHPIGARFSSRCMWRVLRWQLGSRLLPYPIELPWIEGSVFVVERGMTGATGNYYCGLHEFPDMALLLHYFGAESATGGFLDVGANVGSYTILASAVGGQRTLALEPVEETHRKLLRNVQANEIESLVSAPLTAAGGEAGILRFSSDRDTTNQVVSGEYAGEVVDVPVCSLDNLIDEHIEFPEFWKIDVEGFENEVLSGASDSLADPRLKVVLLEAEEEEIARVMSLHGFQRAVYDAFSRHLSIGDDQDSVNNHLWIRNPKEIEARCQASRNFEIFGVQL